MNYVHDKTAEAVCTRIKNGPVNAYPVRDWTQDTSAHVFSFLKHGELIMFCALGSVY